METLDFTNARVLPLTLQQLEMTHKENDIYGKPLKGVYHFELINEIIETANRNGLNCEVYDLFAAQNKDKQQPGVVLLPQVEAEKGKNAVEAHVLRRVYANIRLTDFDDDTYTTNLALSFHQRGVELGFGNNVKICHNQCMLGADNYVSTYGNDKVDISAIVPQAEKWMKEAESRILAERERIERMKQRELSVEEMYILLGMLTVLRVQRDTKIKEIYNGKLYPLNQSQINRLGEAMLLKTKKEEKVSVWDVYNTCTEMYKPMASESFPDTEIPNILSQNVTLGRFLCENYSL
ncbi:MAG: DUF932 domain-containing protein [Paludibacteraceae bacterium]|nr:DUF932 domain-containing protein [Paludibacteraceae bacterium]